MTLIHGLKSTIRYFLAIRLRELVRFRTASALDRLDDRLLADIGVPRNRIAEYAHETAHKAVPVPTKPSFGRKTLLAWLRSWNRRRATIRELSALDGRLLRDIGIEPGRVGDVVDAVLSHRRDLWATHPVVQLSDAMQEVLVPVRHRPSAPNALDLGSGTPVGSGKHATIGAYRTNVVHELQARAANDSPSPEHRRRASVGG